MMNYTLPTIHLIKETTYYYFWKTSEKSALGNKIKPRYSAEKGERVINEEDNGEAGCLERRSSEIGIVSSKIRKLYAADFLPGWSSRAPSPGEIDFFEARRQIFAFSALFKKTFPSRASWELFAKQGPSGSRLRKLANKRTAYRQKKAHVVLYEECARVFVLNSFDWDSSIIRIDSLLIVSRPYCRLLQLYLRTTQSECYCESGKKNCMALIVKIEWKLGIRLIIRVSV